MPHKWELIKNSTKGGHRAREDFQSDLQTALNDFQSAEKIEVERSVLETLGAHEYSLIGEREKVYTHPFPHISSHGKYLFGCFSVPADIDNGTADFSSLFFVASQSRLLTVFKDPSWVYNGTFGGAVLALFSRHEEFGDERVSQTLLKLASFTIAALDHSFDALGNRSEKFEKQVSDSSIANGKEFERLISRNLPPLTVLKDEIEALRTVSKQTVEILARIESGRVTLNPETESPIGFFNNSEMHLASGLFVHAAQIDSYRDALTREIVDSIAKLDRLQDKSLIYATHRVTALGALILFPNLIFDYFGQAFTPLPNWMRTNGWWLTIALTFVYWICQYLYFRRRRFL